MARTSGTGRGWLWLALFAAVTMAHAQTCQTAEDLDTATRNAIETTVRRDFDLARQGDYASLRQNATPELASNFGSIEASVKENQAAFTQAQAKVRPVFVLVADGPQPMARAEFLCGVFGKSGQTADSAVFVLNNLPPGKYAVAVVDVGGTKDARTVTLIMQQAGTEWKLAGFYVRLAQLNGHDGAWFAQKAREFKAKGQTRNAWLYFREAIALSVPVDFMSTMVTDKLYDEMQAAMPSDLPMNGKSLDLSAGGATYHVTDIFPLAVGNDIDVVAKYQAADVSNTAETFKVNSAVTHALVAKFPEFRDAFEGVVVRAVEPSGRDYGSLMEMKDIK